MLHTKFRGNRSTGSREEVFLKAFYHIWAWQPSRSCDEHPVKKIHFLIPESLHIKFGFDWLFGF